MKIVKNKSSQVRMVWFVILLVGPFLLIAYLLRFIPIRIYAQMLIDQGLVSSYAITRAQNLFLEDPVWSSLLGILQGLMWYLMVFVMLKWVEKRPVSLDRFGLAARRNPLWLVGLGIVISATMYFGYLGMGSLLGETEWVWSPENAGVLPLVLIFLNILINGFGEETAFRVYLQNGFIQRHGLWWGIGLTSFIFVLLHLLLYQLSITALAAGILLAGMFGVLTVWTGSIYLAGTLHMVFNLAPRLSGLWPSDLSLLIMNGLGCLITAIIFLQSRDGRILTDRTEQV